MVTISRVALISLAQACNKEDIPKQIVDHWFTMHGKVEPELSKQEMEKIQNENE